MTPRPFDLVIFDCDGVLVDSEPIANRVLCEQLEAAGLSITPDEVMSRFVGRTREGCLTLAAGLLGRPLPTDFAEEWDAALFDALRLEVRPIDGVESAIRGLTIPFCAATNGTRGPGPPKSPTNSVGNRAPRLMRAWPDNGLGRNGIRSMKNLCRNHYSSPNPPIV